MIPNGGTSGGNSEILGPYVHDDDAWCTSFEKKKHLEFFFLFLGVLVTW